MRRTFQILSAVCILSLMALPAYAGSEWSVEKWKASADKHDWEGLGVGSMTHFKTTSKNKIKAMPNMAAQESVIEHKKTLVKITDTHLHFKEEMIMAGMPPQVSEKKELRKPATSFKFEEDGTGKVKVGGTELECKKWKVTTTLEGGMTTVGHSLEHAEHGVVEMSSTSNGQTHKMTCSKLSTSVSVGGTQYTGREFTSKMAAQGGTMKMVWSHEVPGRTVKTTTVMDNDQMTMNSVRELVAFVKK